jgi:hypothetical protein
MKMKKEYHDNFANWADVLSNFNVKDIPEPDLVFAAYETPPYEGRAYVVFKDDAGWHYVYGGHCSCYGLEGNGTSKASILKLKNRPSPKIELPFPSMKTAI